MAEHAECKTIYMSPELKQASDHGLKGGQEILISEVKPRSSHRLNQPYDRGLRRSFGSTDLLHNAHPNALVSSDSADSLEGAVPLHSDSSGEHHRVDEKFQSSTDVGPKSREGSMISLDELELHAGEGKGGDRKSRAKTEQADKEEKEEEEEEVEDEEERWVDASECRGSTVEGRRVKGKKCEEEKGGEEEEAVRLPVIGQSGKKLQDLAATATAISEDAKYLQHFHSLPKSVLSSEITHCLYMLEEECRGVEKESETVKWKMEFIHSSMQCVQETLRTLLIRLVEAQSSDSHSQDSTPDQARPPPPPIHRLHHPSYPRAVDTNPNHSSALAHHHHHHHSQCRAPHPVPSKTCLMDTLNPGHCCQESPLPTDMPSCAQRAKERAAAFSTITELRADVERLRAAHLEERQEQREVLRVLQDFQRQVEDLIKAQRNSSDQEGSSEPLSAQLLELKQEVQEVANMTREAMSVLKNLGTQLESMQEEANSKQADKRQS
ncbi:hypothetical protein ACEWY4_025548 [Coilia grayii]|uniref:Uncharacterized protein n=1 Tax=Coilia grayii TaxID=363190 RepID=A0ABD1IY05_9TELE